ncbi:hypothetical protein [Niastella populi]|uniref:Metallo-beta-lactamase domain-containing protein n=1 Tax=Niastella populi TaxID=550983 RepID=A0A1V9FDT5_9BACT|nr:hypothetical protein [Niastella populi]OQP56451.1 hypothetical protein A4R26_04635 [Niastella populi]
MYYSRYKRLFPGDVLVCIEELNIQDNTVLFDFIDSNEYTTFTDLINRAFDLTKPSMVLLNNYQGRPIQENTIYSIKPETIQSWSEQVNNSEDLNSFLIGYIIDVSNAGSEIFDSSVSLNDFLDWRLNYYMNGYGDSSAIPFHRKGKLSVTVRDVGQGNWNEINFNDETKVVYDAGAPMNASKPAVLNIIGNRNVLYKRAKPILILSHWDKDHYHSLLGMSNVDLQNNFSAFVCRDRVPNLTSRILFGRLNSSLGPSNTYSIPADVRRARGGATFFRNLNSLNNQIIIYNAQYHKNRNISGIALSVKSKKESIILSGDAHYEQVSRDILAHLNYRHRNNLVVPHHGGKAGTYVYKIPPLVRVKNAIISVGANRYGHPNTSYIGALHLAGFSIHQTNIAQNDITIYL